MNELFATNHFIKFKLTAKSNSYASAFWIMIRLCTYVIIPRKETASACQYIIAVAVWNYSHWHVSKNLPTRIQLGCGRIILDDDHIIFYIIQDGLYMLALTSELYIRWILTYCKDCVMIYLCKKKWNMLTFYMQTRRVHNEKPGSNVMYTTVWMITKTFHREHSWKHLLNSL